MSVRLEALSRALFELFPPSLEPVYVAVTSLGDSLVLVGVLAALFWTSDRRRGMLAVVSYVFVGFATIVALKGVFAAPRPEAALIEAHGYGFPSGHSLGAVVVYGAIAREFDWLSDRRTFAAVAALVAAVGLSRVALRVHYLGDVLVGFAVGIGILAVVPRVTGERPLRTFALAGLVGLVAVAVTDASPDSVAVVGGSLAGVSVTSLYARRDGLPALTSRSEALALSAVGFPLAGAAKVSATLLPSFPGVSGVDEFLLVVVVLLLPLAFETAGVTSRFGTVEDGA